MGTGWGIPGWVPGWVIPGHPAGCSRRSPDSEAGPGSPAGAGVGGLGAGRTGTVMYHPAGPVGSPGPSLYMTSQKRPSTAIGTRIDLILLKVSQKDEVSPEYVQKACHSPYFQNDAQKSPLGFLRFPFLAAFSPKELMGHFLTIPRTLLSK